MTYEEMKKLEVNFDKLAKKIHDNLTDCPYSEKEIAYQLYNGCSSPFIMIALHNMENGK